MYEFLEYRVDDVMTRDPVTIGPDTTVGELQDLFESRDFNGVPVVDESGRLVGWATKLDLLSAFRFDDSRLFPPYAEIMQTPVANVMRREVQTVTPLAPLTRVLEKMIETRSKSFPVVDDGLLVGVVAREDLLAGLRRAVSGEKASGPI